MQQFVEHLTPLMIAIAVLGNWRISSLVSNENGPFHVFKKFRLFCLELCKKNWFCKKLHLYELVECEWCNSVYFCGITIILWYFIGDIILLPLLWLALSACVIFLKFVIQNMEAVLKLLNKLSS